MTVTYPKEWGPKEFVPTAAPCSFSQFFASIFQHAEFKKIQCCKKVRFQYKFQRICKLRHILALQKHTLNCECCNVKSMISFGFVSFRFGATQNAFGSKIPIFWPLWRLSSSFLNHHHGFNIFCHDGAELWRSLLKLQPLNKILSYLNR